MVDKSVLAFEVDTFIKGRMLNYGQEDESVLLGSMVNLMTSIPQKRKSSYGIVSVIALFCYSIHAELGEASYDVGLRIYKNSTDYRSVSIGLGLISHVGIKRPKDVLLILEDASDHDLWEVKEFVQMFIRKITKVHKEIVQAFLIELTQSDNPCKRRFASEALRPVVENRWIQETPEYSLKVLRELFTETEQFPKVSVGNNLSDLSRKNPELILNVVKDLKEMKNEHSDFIAHRACRILVKSQPLRVMDILGIKAYKYKNNVYNREHYLT